MDRMTAIKVNTKKGLEEVMLPKSDIPKTALTKT